MRRSGILKGVLRTAAVCLVAFLVVTVIAGVFVAEAILHPYRRPLTAEAESEARSMAARQHSRLADVAIVASDGVTLRGWRIRPRSDNHGAVILLHGLADNRLGMIGYAELLLSHGFTVLLPDVRAQGTSEGEFATYGLLEADDIRHWFNLLESTEHPDCIFGFGVSMGAAQLLQSLRAQPRFCAVVVESPFSSMREIAYDRVGQFFHTGPWLGRSIFRPVIEAAFTYARWKYKLDFERASPEAAVAVTRTPVLLIHGRSDRNIPVRHSRCIAARNPAVVLWEVPGADHCGAFNTSPDEFRNRLMGWFGSYATEQHRLAASAR